MRLLSTLAAAAVSAVLIAAPAVAKEIKLGVSAGSHEQVAEKVAEIIKAKGHTLKIVTFNDYILPNQALASGDLDANSFQHVPYLDQQKKDRGYDLTVVGTNFVEPMGVYSKKIKTLADLKAGDSVAIPNDPSNGGRALLLLAKQGLIEVDAKTGLTPGAADITKNPKGLKFVELDAAQLPRSLPDVTAAAINTNYALEAGLNPLKDSLVIEDAKSPYANIVVVQTKDKDAAWVKDLVAAYQNDQVRAFILETFKGAVVPAF
ncbi:MetQ/NlpA family ABC transporter substrate-binding protein [Novispirillum itersonii]|uniref:D-methionine transport system substrate-binding protein n=1 Tax=Novispirillum itersonii TaxID=189 RepID=A0A7W9ZHC7_NOVIT|nr:MetQ/NlpA family ABC transporter substrate-binding protein [Novispirillum itersonii]MBB6211492.1 D-methionine transport system substrate-binding protein [Novispirillum itersonii]